MILPENLAYNAIEIRQASPVPEIGQPRSTHHPIELVLCPPEHIRVQNHCEHEVRHHRHSLSQIMYEKEKLWIVEGSTYRLGAGCEVCTHHSTPKFHTSACMEPHCSPRRSGKHTSVNHTSGALDVVRFLRGRPVAAVCLFEKGSGEGGPSSPGRLCRFVPSKAVSRPHPHTREATYHRAPDHLIRGVHHRLHHPANPQCLALEPGARHPHGEHLH